MNYHQYTYILILMYILCLAIQSFSKQLILLQVLFTPNSILEKKELYKPLAVGDRIRYATCTGTAWFHKNYLALLNLYGNNLITYFFDKEKNTFHVLQKITNESGACLKNPENLCFSPDGTLLAVAHSTSGITLYSVDINTHLINPKPVTSLTTPHIVHNVKFSPDNTYLAYACFDPQKSICIYKIKKCNTDYYLELTYHTKNTWQPLKAKALTFTQSCKHIIIAYALSINDSTTKPFQSMLACHEFDHQQGTLGNIISKVEGCFSIEDLCLTDNDSTIIATDQGHDSLIFYSFDSITGIIENTPVVLDKTHTKVSFPHGIAISQDEKYLSVANYGNDSCIIYTLTSS